FHVVVASLVTDMIPPESWRGVPPAYRARCTRGTVASGGVRRPADETRSLQQQVDLAAEAEGECGVEKGGDEGRTGRDRQRPVDAGDMQDQVDRDDDEADTLREARRTGIFELGRGGQPWTHEAAEDDAPGDRKSVV